jgi:hypothetical protein
VFDASGLKLVDAGHTHDCRKAERVVWVGVERRPTGYLSRGDHFVVAVDHAGQVIARVDTSESLSPMRPDCVEHLCELAEVEFEVVETPDVETLLDSRPELVPPKLEFEVDHPNEEGLREVAVGIGLFVPLSLILGGCRNGSLRFRDPVRTSLPASARVRCLGGWCRCGVEPEFVAGKALPRRSGQEAGQGIGDPASRAVDAG